MLAVITPTLPERAEMLAELRADLEAQTYPKFTHLVGVDDKHEGPATVRNKLVASTSADWLAFIDDDDRVRPNHLEVLFDCWYRTRADVCYTQCLIEGRDGFAVFHDCDHTDLVEKNTVPMTTLVRREMFDRAGGFPTDEWDEDHGLWKRILAAGGTFGCDHRVTWTYRYHGSNRSWRR